MADVKRPPHIEHNRRATATATRDDVLSHLMAAFTALADGDRAIAAAHLRTARRMVVNGHTPKTSDGLTTELNALIERLDTEDTDA